MYVANREADLVAMTRRAHELDTPLDWLVRAKHNRCLLDVDLAAIYMNFRSQLFTEKYVRSQSRA